jgi:hypothetical protein
MVPHSDIMPHKDHIPDAGLDDWVKAGRGRYK